VGEETEKEKKRRSKKKEDDQIIKHSSRRAGINNNNKQVERECSSKGGIVFRYKREKKKSVPDYGIKDRQRAKHTRRYGVNKGV